MFTKFASITAAVALGIAGVAISANTANGGAVEYFKCSLAEGKTMEDLVSVASHFHAVIADAGIEGYRFLSFTTVLLGSQAGKFLLGWDGNRFRHDRRD